MRRIGVLFGFCLTMPHMGAFSGYGKLTDFFKVDAEMIKRSDTEYPDK